VGFHYAFDAPSGQFAHATAIMILTPKGARRAILLWPAVSHPDVRLGLVEASNGTIGSPTEQRCFFATTTILSPANTDWWCSNVIRIAGIITTLALAIFLGLMFRHEKYKLFRRKVCPTR